MSKASDLDEAGFTLVPDVLAPPVCAAIESEPRSTRCLLDRARCADLASRLVADPRLQRLIPHGHVAVQCTYSDKSPQNNWLVALHHDLSIPVTARVNGFELQGWAKKEGDLYVQAPVEVLSQLVAVLVPP